MNATRERRLVPGLAFHALTPLYDRALRLIFDETALKRRFLDHAALAPGQPVLDLGLWNRDPAPPLARTRAPLPGIRRGR